MTNQQENSGKMNLRMGVFFIILGCIFTYFEITQDETFLIGGIAVLGFSTIFTIFLYFNIKTKENKANKKEDSYINNSNLRPVQEKFISNNNYERRQWQYEIKGNAAIWLVSILFTLIGGIFMAIGVFEEEMFLFVGAPFLCLGLTILSGAIYSLKLKRKNIEKYKRFLWYLNFSGGLLGYELMAIGSLIVLPIFLLFGMTDSDSMLAGGIASGIGIILTLLSIPLIKWQLKERPWLKNKNL